MSEPLARRGDRLQTATELALAGVTAGAIVGMHLLFADGSFFPPLLLQAMAAHLTMAVLRRLGFRLVPAALVTLAIGAIFVASTQYLDTTVAFLPSPDTLSAVDADMDEAWRLFQDVKAPAPVVPGFVVATSLAVWIIVFIADWGAFRTGVSFEALLPPATLFLFAAVLGDQGGTRVPGAALFVAAALVFLLLHRTWRQEASATWAAVNHQRGHWSILSSGTGLASLAVVIGAIVGPNLPGADDVPAVPWRQLTDENEARVVLSPLVDIRSRLVDQSDLQVFRVRTDDPDFGGSYWRVTALDEFNGTIWRSSYDTDDADGNLPDSVDADADVETTTVSQTIDIQALEAIWLPAAFRPVALETDDAEVDYDADSSTLIVDESSESSDGLSYTVVSEVPRWTDEQLRTAEDADIPDDIRDHYRQLPQGFSPEIQDLATNLTSQQDTPYDKAKALQDYLRGPDFTYDLENVQPGHSEDALEDFLLTNKRGYCEQFAGSFAAMARSVGLPSRVVIGFTEGIRDPEDRTLWVVTGMQAHAWVEVYLEGFGWVTFDPTPGRGPSDADAWLGITEQQAVPGGTSGDAPAPLPDDAAQPAGPGPAPDAGGAPGELNADALTPSSTPSNDDDSGLVPDVVVAAAKPIGIGVLAYLLVVPLALISGRYLRRLRARAPAEKVDLAWREATDEAAESGVTLALSLTVAERAIRMRSALPDMAQEIDLVARWVEQVNYAEVSPTPEQADDAAQAAAAVVTAAARRQPWHLRTLRYFDARRLLPQPEHARRSAHTTVRTA